MDQVWEIGISKFRSCGGVAENILQKVGINGRGIFPVDSKIKSKIFVPSNLLINREDVILKEGQLKIKDGTGYSKEVVDFFNFYQQNFSWGNGGKEEIEEYESDLYKFPNDIKEFLKEKGIIDINERHNKLSINFILETFLNNRGFKFKGKKILAPYLELVNYSPKSSFLLVTHEGIYHPEIDISDQEITHHYCHMSSLERWVQCGFSCEEPIVFSIPFEFYISGTGLKLCCKGKSLDKEQINFPRINEKIIIEGLPIAHINLRNFSMNYLFYVSNRINIKFNLEGFLQKIIDYNINTRIELIKKIGKQNSLAAQSLIQSLSTELETIDNSF